MAQVEEGMVSSVIAGLGVKEEHGDAVTQAVA